MLSAHVAPVGQETLMTMIIRDILLVILMAAAFWIGVALALPRGGGSSGGGGCSNSLDFSATCNSGYAAVL
jgi:hypothetical protein